MAYALVGTGPVGTGTSGAAFTPSWGTLPRTAGHLLITWGFCSNGTTLSGVAGWNNAGHGNTNQYGIAWKLAAGGDAAPTWPAVSGGTWTAMTGEFSGNLDVANPIDRNWIGTTIVGSTVVATDTQVPLLAGELILSTSGCHYAAAAARTLTESYNNGATANNVANNNAASVVNHYTFDWGIMTSKAANPSATLTFTGAPGNATVEAVSFQLAVSLIQRTLVGVGL